MPVKVEFSRTGGPATDANADVPTRLTDSKVPTIGFVTVKSEAVMPTTPVSDPEAIVMVPSVSDATPDTAPA